MTPITDPARIFTAASITLLFASSLTVMSNATISASLPSLADHFRETPGVQVLAGLVLTLPSLGVALLALMAGAAADAFGRRRALMVGLVCYGLAGASGLFVDSLTALLIGRFLLGLSVAIVMTSAGALTGDLFAGPARERFLGLQASAMSVAGIVFLSAGGFLAALSWRAPFSLYLAAFVILIAVPFVVPYRQGTAASGPASAPADPMPWRTLAGVGAVAAVAMAAFYMLPVKLPFRLREIGVDAPSIAGITVAASTVTSALTASQYGRLRRSFSGPLILQIAFAIMAVGFLVIGVTNSYAVTLGGVLVTGIGLGVVFPGLSSLVYQTAPPARRGLAMGVFTTAIFTGQFISPFLSSALSTFDGLWGAYVGVALILLAFAPLIHPLVAPRRT